MRVLLVTLVCFISFSALGQNDSTVLSTRPLPSLGNLYFPENISEIQEAHRTELQVIAEHLKTHPNVGLIIIGHTDDIGDRKDNAVVSIIRAKNVYDYLVYKGVDKKQLSYGGQGEDYPIFRDTTDFARQKNRRVALRYFYLE
jgi:outer membrane protein OmpA-like peptidoglycan-associated protein